MVFGAGGKEVLVVDEGSEVDVTEMTSLFSYSPENSCDDLGSMEYSGKGEDCSV